MSVPPPHEPESTVATPVRRWRNAAPAVVVVASVIASGGGIAWATRLPPSPTTATTAFIPRDGEVTVESVESSSGQAVVVAEHARMRGAEGIVALPGSFGEAAITASLTLDIPHESLALWRSTSRRVLDGELGSQVSAVYADTPDGIVLLSSVGGSFAQQYDPPLLVFPADHTVGHTWTGTGNALPQGIATYAIEGEITGVEDDCVRQTVRLSLVDSEGTSLTDAESEETWCEGDGASESTVIFELEDRTETVRTVSTPDADLPIPSATELDAAQARWADVATWNWTPTSTIMVDTLFGDLDVGGTTAAPPTVTASGRLVVAYESGDDVVAYDTTDTGLSVAWRGHPGGSILSVAAIGDVVVVTTTERQTIAYDTTGIRLWTASTDDLVLVPAVADGAGHAVTVGLDGRVIAIDALTGDVDWTTELVTDADVPAAAADGTVVAADRNGTVLAVDARDGGHLWESSGDQVVDIASGPDGTVVSVDDRSVVTARRLDDGSEVWSAAVDGVDPRIVSLDALTVVVTNRSTTAFDADGTVSWSAEGGDLAVGAGEVVLVGDAAVLTAIDASGKVVESWEPSEDDGPGSAGIDAIDAVAADGGAWIVSDLGEVSWLGGAS